MAARRTSEVDEAVQNLGEDAKLAGDDLAASLSRLRTDLDDVRHQLVRAGGETAGAARDAALEQVTAMQHQLEGVADEARRRGREAGDAIDRYVRDKPMASIAMAFGVGWVMARLFGRR